ncbi:MAG TPA: hypothetical protein VK957_14050, partial [Lunatimonas sp.]|nr:hypothetical protein [Lunatimonas sp.]
MIAKIIMFKKWSLLILLQVPIILFGQEHSLLILSEADIIFLEKMTADVLEQSRIYPQQYISATFGSNETGGTLIRPGGKDAYPSFWIRDYALSLETGMVGIEEQLHMLTLTASTQSEKTWITKGGSLVPFGAIADHIRIDTGEPIYFPGTYSFAEQGTSEWGSRPPYCDQYFFIHMAHNYVIQSGYVDVLNQKINGISLIDRLMVAFQVPPSLSQSDLIFADDRIRGVDFGFRDAITITGELSFASILKYKAAVQLSDLLQLLDRREEAGHYLQVSTSLKNAIPETFRHPSGLLLASTGKSSQPDVWGTALAVYFGVLDGEDLKKASQALVEGFVAGQLSYRGNIRHVLTIHDFDATTAWEVSMAPKNRYQNGAYWGTPTGWVCYAMYQTDPERAI